MKIITISREFGSGGRELGKLISDYLNFDYYDSEIITAVTERCGMDKTYVTSLLENHGWRDFPLTFRASLGSGFQQTNVVSLLLEQKKVIEEIAAMGKDFVIVGRNADVLLSEFKPFNLFVCAQPQAKVERCMAHATNGERLSEKELLRKMRQIDRVRSQTRMLLSGSEWGRRDAYHLTVNTTGQNIKELAPIVADFALKSLGRIE